MTIRTSLNMNQEDPILERARKMVLDFYENVKVASLQFSEISGDAEHLSDREQFLRMMKYYISGMIGDIQTGYSDLASKFNQAYENDDGLLMHNIPEWMEKLMMKDSSRNNKGEIIMYNDRRDLGFDHTCRIQFCKQNLIVTNPYQIHKAQLKKLIPITDALGVDFVIRGETPYFPSNTLMIAFANFKNEKLRIPSTTFIE